MTKKKKTASKKKTALRAPLPKMTYQLARDMRGSDLARDYQHVVDDLRARKAILAGSRAANLQIEYGKIREHISRMPTAFQGDAVQRLKALERELTGLQQQYSLNFPRGPYPGDREDERRRRLLE